MFRSILRTVFLISATFALWFAPQAFAQDQISDKPNKIERSIVTDAAEALEEREVAREVDELPGDVEPQPEDPDFADTALVFTNMRNTRAGVKCVAFNKNGVPVGRTRTPIPPLGVRYVLASDMSDGEDFVGQVQCAPYGRVMGSVVFIGPGLTDLPVRNGRLGKSRIRFPLVAHY